MIKLFETDPNPVLFPQLDERVVFRKGDFCILIGQNSKLILNKVFDIQSKSTNGFGERQGLKFFYRPFSNLDRAKRIVADRSFDGFHIFTTGKFSSIFNLVANHILFIVNDNELNHLKLYVYKSGNAAIPSRDYIPDLEIPIPNRGEIG